MPGLVLWERRQRETSKAFAAFVAYRDLPALDRSAAAAAKSVKGNHRQFTRWSTQHSWIERGAAYDDYLDHRKLENNMDLVDAMSIRQAESAMKVQEIAVKSLQRLCAEMEDNENKRLGEADIIAFLTSGTALERTARGKSSSISEIINNNSVVEIEWKGPPVEGDDASDASRPVEGAPE